MNAVAQWISATELVEGSPGDGAKIEAGLQADRERKQAKVAGGDVLKSEASHVAGQGSK